MAWLPIFSSLKNFIVFWKKYLSHIFVKLIIFSWFPPINCKIISYKGKTISNSLFPIKVLNKTFILSSLLLKNFITLSKDNNLSNPFNA